MSTRNVVFRVTGRGKAQEKQGTAAGRVSVAGLQGTHACAPNEGEAKQKRLSERGVGTGECTAAATGSSWKCACEVVPCERTRLDCFGMVDFCFSSEITGAAVRLLR